MSFPRSGGFFSVLLGESAQPAREPINTSLPSSLSVLGSCKYSSSFGVVWTNSDMGLKSFLARWVSESVSLESQSQPAPGTVIWDAWIWLLGSCTLEQIFCFFLCTSWACCRHSRHGYLLYMLFVARRDHRIVEQLGLEGSLKTT